MTTYKDRKITLFVEKVTGCLVGGLIGYVFYYVLDTLHNL